MNKPFRKFESMSGIRDFHVSSDEGYLIAVSYDLIKIFDVGLGCCIESIKFESCPRVVRLSSNGKFFAVYDNSTGVRVYETATATLLQAVVGVPQGIKHLRISRNANKMFWASSQLVCLWNIAACRYEIYSETWKNINCYDLNADGSQFALGNFNGIITIISYIGNGNCSKIELKKHQTCVISICFHKNKLISVSYDGHLLISTLCASANGERKISYRQLEISEVPRQIQSIGDQFYMYLHHGITWLTPQMLVMGLVDSNIYKPFVNEQGNIAFVKLVATELEWWSEEAIRNQTKN